LSLRCVPSLASAKTFFSHEPPYTVVERKSFNPLITIPSPRNRPSGGQYAME
jgi:hypothetical protein